jgi:hypothetical protein
MKNVLYVVAILLCGSMRLAAEESFAYASSSSFASYQYLPAERDAHSNSVSPVDRVFSVLAWPGYSIASRDPGPQGRTQKFMLGAERLSFVLDFVSTAKTVYPGSKLVERDALNTVWGNQNRPAILGSMLGWEMAFSFAAAYAPRRFHRGVLGHIVRPLSVLATGFMTEEHFRAGVCNLQLYNRSQLSATDSCMLFGR